MSIQDIFERVSFIIPIEQRKFLDYFADTVAELEAMYSDFVFDKNSVYCPPEALSDENAVLPLYCNAIVDNIIFLSGGDEKYKSEFLRKARVAYLKYWNDNAKGKRIKRMRW